MNPTQNPLQNVQVPPPFGGVPGVPPQFLALYQWSLYRFTGIVALQDYRVFTVTRGNPGQGYLTPLTARETSLTGQGAQVSLQKNWTVWDIGVFVKPTDDLPDVEQLIDVTTLCIEQNDIVTQIGPAEMFPAGGAVFGTADASSAGVGSSWGNGLPQVSARRSQGDRPWLLPAGQQFSFIFRINRSSGVPITLAEGASVELGVSLWVWEDKSVTQGG